MYISRMGRISAVTRGGDDVSRKKSPTVTETEARSVLAMADNGMTPMRAARAIGYSRNAIYYHLACVHEKTGKDPHDFWDLCDLVPMARKILRGESHE